MAEDGIQITLRSDHASFNFPYWDSLDAGKITDDIGRAAQIVAAETGWRLYDPQLEEFIDSVSDAEKIQSAFDYGRKQLAEIIEQENAPPPERKSFWKRLFGGE
jgi:hypothetical protein